MALSEIITAMAIHLIVPFVGVVVFLLLCHRMSQAQVPSAPYFSWFVLFGTFGAWLLVVLTALFWKWSGMASIGVFGLLLVAPFTTAAVAFSLRTRRGLSQFHRGAFYASVGYSGLMLITVLGWLGVWIVARPDPAMARQASEAAERQVRSGMSISDVVAIAAGQEREFRVLGFCGPKGALNVHGDGGDAALIVWRGSPSGGFGSETPVELRFDSVAALRTALNEQLLSDGSCSKLSVGFTGGWQFHVILGVGGLVKGVEPTQPWD